MKKFMLMLLVILLAFGCLGCQNTEGDEAANDEPKVYNLDVSFTATVDELVDDPNMGDDVPRYAVVRPFQGEPVLVDVGTTLAKTLEEDTSYRFVMEQKLNISMVEEKAYNLNTIIPLYDLKVKSVDTPSDDQYGPDSVNIEYTETTE